MAHRWKRYFELNFLFENDIDVLPPLEGPIENITELEVRKVFQRMTNSRATGPSGVAAEVLNAADKKIPDSWD